MIRVLCVLVALSLAALAYANSEIRLAVVDFQPSGAVGEYDTLGAGLQSMLTTDLSAVSTLTVVERAQLAALQRELKLSRSALADPKTALRLGKMAGASHLLTGSFTLVGDKMRLDARVIEVATAKVHFAAKIEGEKDAFFELEKNLAAQVIESVGVQPSAKERSVLGRVHTADFAAFQKFSQGLVLFDEQHYERAFDALKDAAKRDEEFKLARSTLQQYERLSAELRSKAQVLEAQAAVEAARERQAELSKTEQVQQRLLAIADKSSAPKRERAAALYLLASMKDVSDDHFADERMRELFVARYMQEFSPLFPQFAITPVEPFGERWGTPDPPEDPGKVSAAVAKAAAAITFQQSDLRAEHFREQRQESLSANFRTRTFEHLVELLPLDYSGRTNALQRLYDLGAKAVPGEWRSNALRMIARRRRGSLELDESTRLFREAAVLDGGADAMRGVAREIDENAAFARALEKTEGNACLREDLMFDAAAGNSPSSSSTSAKSPCATRELLHSRMLRENSALIVNDMRAWLLKNSSAVVWSGPRPDALRAHELRYVAGQPPNENDTLPRWAVLMLEGIPRARAVVQFSLGYEPTQDHPIADTMARGDPAPKDTVPKLTVFFGARSVLAMDREHQPIPMRATGITFSARSVSLSEVQAELRTSSSETLRVTPGKALPIDVPRKGLIAVKITRDQNRIAVEIAGKQLQFDARTATHGFIGIAWEGAGFVRVAKPTITGMQ